MRTTSALIALAALAALAAACFLLPASAVAQRPSRGTVRVESFDSPALGVRKHYVVYLPPSYATSPRRRFPVAYYLHGADGNEGDWVTRAAIDRVMDSLVARGAPEMILVMPDGDESWYANSATPADPEACARGRYGEDPSLRCVRRADYETYLARDLVRHVDSAYRTRADRAHRAIGGLSMGGLGAMHAALAHPDVFGAAVSHSGIVSLLFVGPHPYAAPATYATASLDTLRAGLGDRLWGEMRATLGDGVGAWRAFDPTELARRLRAAKDPRRPLPALYFDAGAGDQLSIDRNRAFDAELAALGVAHTWRQWPGGHEWRYWHDHVGDGLAWLGSVIGR